MLSFRQTIRFSRAGARAVLHSQHSDCWSCTFGLSGPTPLLAPLRAWAASGRFAARARATLFFFPFFSTCWNRLSRFSLVTCIKHVLKYFTIHLSAGKGASNLERNTGFIISLSRGCAARLFRMHVIAAVAPSGVAGSSSTWAKCGSDAPAFLDRHMFPHVPLSGLTGVSATIQSDSGVPNAASGPWIPSTRRERDEAFSSETGALAECCAAGPRGRAAALVPRHGRAAHFHPVPGRFL